MSMQVLHTNIVSLLGEISTLNQVSSRPTFEFPGFPSCFVAESGNTNDFQDTVNNLRIYSYNVWVFEEFDKGTLDDAYSSLRQTVDAIVDKFDEQESPTSGRELANDLPAGKTLMKVWATPSEFVYDEEVKLLAARINVRLSVHVQLTTL